MSYAVLVMDMARHLEEGAEQIVRGFGDFEQAREYARRRVRDSIESLRRPGMSPGEVCAQWSLAGAYALVIGLRGYSASEELERFFAEPASAEQRAWKLLEPPKP